MISNKTYNDVEYVLNCTENRTLRGGLPVAENQALQADADGLYPRFKGA